MLRHAATALVVIAALAWPVAAQTTTTTDATDLAANTPAENASAGFVSERAPGTWVQAALSRHSGLQAIRLTGPRFGQPNTEEGAIRAAGNSGTASSASTGGLSSLLSLVTQLGGLDSLADLSGTGTTTGTGTGTTTGSTDYTLEDLIALGQAYENSTQKSSHAAVTTPASKSAAARSSAITQTGGAIARLPKRFQTSQTTTDDTTDTTTESSFAVRWTNAMLGTFFSALTVGFQSSSFISMLEDALRPLVLPSSDSSTDGNDSGNNNNNNNSNGIDGDGSNASNDGNSTI